MGIRSKPRLFSSKKSTYCAPAIMLYDVLFFKSSRRRCVLLAKKTPLQMVFAGQRAQEKYISTVIIVDLTQPMSSPLITAYHATLKKSPQIPALTRLPPPPPWSQVQCRDYISRTCGDKIRYHLETFSSLKLPPDVLRYL